MSKKRFINTKFWSDNFIVQLDPLERYLFLYFLTNEHTNISGVYELPLRTMAFETGIEQEMLLKIVSRLSGKVFYIDGWVYIKNFIKNQIDNNSVRTGVENAMKDVPSEIANKIRQLEQTGDSLYTEADISKLKSESKLKLKSELNFRESTPAEQARNFFNQEQLQIRTTQDLINSGMPEQMAIQEIRKFIAYWTEPTASGKKQRWQTERTFEINRRLATWFSRIKEFKQTKQTMATI